MNRNYIEIPQDESATQVQKPATVIRHLAELEGSGDKPNIIKLSNPDKPEEFVWICPQYIKMFSDDRTTSALLAEITRRNLQIQSIRPLPLTHKPEAYTTKEALHGALDVFGKEWGVSINPGDLIPGALRPIKYDYEPVQINETAFPKRITH